MYQRSRRKLVVPFLVPAFIVYSLLMFVPLALYRCLLPHQLAGTHPGSPVLRTA